MSLSLTIVVRRQIEASNAGKTLWRSKWGSFAAASCRDQCWVGIDVGTGRDRLRQMSWRQGSEIPSEISTLSEVAKRWLQGDLSKLPIKSIIIVKPLICALNSALNLDKPLTASKFVIKALRPFTAMLNSGDRPPAYWLRGMIRKRRFWAFPSSQFRCLFVRIKIGLSKIWWFPSACWIRHASRRLASAWYIGQINTTDPSA